MVHELQKVLPAFASEAGLDVTQEGQVLFPWVCLGKEVLKCFPKGQQDKLLVHWFIPSIKTDQAQQFRIAFHHICTVHVSCHLSTHPPSRSAVSLCWFMLSTRSLCPACSRTEQEVMQWYNDAQCNTYSLGELQVCYLSFPPGTAL